MTCKCKAHDLMHPTGQCTCAGEGKCPWCRYIEVRELFDDVSEELKLEREKYMELLHSSMKILQAATEERKLLVDIITELNDHEGAEGWSRDLRKKIKKIISG